jgi:decaprenyl-phosphate phosphoribosyltransferase
VRRFTSAQAPAHRVSVACSGMAPVQGGESTVWTPASLAAPALEANREDPATASAEVPPHRGFSRALLVTARPKQWIKNALVIAAPGAAGALGHDDVPGRVLAACLAFCLISAGIYALNDCRDAEEDRRHPRKRTRPVAAGQLTVRDALVAGVAWLACGILACFLISPLLGLVGLGYVALTLSYTVLWRRVVVMDVVAVGGGFVLRALAGGVAAPVTLSRWFVLVVSAAALFIAFGKRHAELRRVRGGRAEATPGRRVLRGYSERGLRLLLAASCGCALFAYWVWAMALPDVDGVPWRMLTALPFTACLLRYASLVAAGEGEAPEDTVLRDPVLVLAGSVWLVLFGLTVHATG